MGLSGRKSIQTEAYRWEDGPQAGTCWCLWDSKMPCNWNRVGKEGKEERRPRAMGGTEQAVTFKPLKDFGFYSA